MAFDNHLRARKDVYFFLSKSFEDRFEFVTASRGIPVESLNPGLRKKTGEVFFHFLRSDTSEKEFFAGALRAEGRRVTGIAAIRGSVTYVASCDVSD